MSQMRTLSDADVYRLPDGPMHNAVIGFSPLWIRPGLVGLAQTTPEELNNTLIHILITQNTNIYLKILHGLLYPVRLSQARTYDPQAEYSRPDLRSNTTDTTGPGCEMSACGPVEPLPRSQIRTVRS